MSSKCHDNRTTSVTLVSHPISLDAYRPMHSITQLAMSALAILHQRPVFQTKNAFAIGTSDRYVSIRFIR